ncbi:Cof-type HAD-IIB family hydrolase [Neobacillus sp. PS3-34]|uniref:Cof-type HAD-IIB family hydrolase n=1 Tax=Neobacillus sp. PS3-34 TaxID=3070678 RepID=UPI0027DF2DC4|nr:Cof-type HAD-IIB family hydrolase [Neobacillus sp. PS3-34]WML48793.1 Cof-type HAD-IIB family hydrolase [Neobacillus sp. PS3-34]
MENYLNDLDIKLIALDMDGTLLNEKGEISEENRKAIAEAQQRGIYVVLSTGRSIATSREHAESLQLSSFLVTVNGSEIWDAKGELVERNIVKSDSVKWMWELSQKHGTKFWATAIDNVWDEKMPEDILSTEWLKFGFVAEDDRIREEILKELQERSEFEISNSSPINIEVNALGINKAKGLKTVCEKLGIELKNVMAVGDSLNDIAMITEAGLGVAMGNAQQTVKDAANWVTATNNENGVAHAIKKLVLKEE